KDKTGILSEGAEDELIQLKKALLDLKNQRTTTNAQYQSIRSQLSRMEKALLPKKKKVSNNYIKIKNKLDYKKKEKIRLESMGIIVQPSSDISQTIEDLEKQLIDVREKEGLSQVEGLSAFELSKQWRRLKELQDKVTAHEVELELLDNKINFYKREILLYHKSHPELLQKAAELDRLRRQKEISEQTYQRLLDQYYKIKTETLPAEQGKITISDEPRLPNRAEDKLAGRFYLIGALLGLIIGFLIALLQEYMDNSVKSTDDVENYLKISVLGTIPHIDLKDKKTVQVNRRSSHQAKKTQRSYYPGEILDFYRDETIASEAYRSLRTNLFFASPDNPIRTLVISSSGPHEGKSLTATNLALSCAHAGKRTLLIDTDLRRPVIHHILQMKRENGFSDMFLDNATLDKSIKPSGVENLWVITAGHFTPNPAELLTSKKIETFIGYFKEQYDLAIFDTPPLLAVTDAALLSVKTDGIVLVIKAGKTSIDVVNRATATLRNIRVHIFGAILNDIDLKRSHSSYGYYKYYYHYYRSKKE
ncbi:MAG: polysaccharide biosynthesis tyrosine autokinase, partial [bacterium]